MIRFALDLNGPASRFDGILKVAAALPLYGKIPTRHGFAGPVADLAADREACQIVGKSFSIVA